MVVAGPSGIQSDDSDDAEGLSEACLPVTALAFFRIGAGQLLLAAGIGAELVLYNVNRCRRREVSRTRVLRYDRIHGISATEGATCRLICRGGRELAICQIVGEVDDAIEVSVDCRTRCRHWILDARLVPPSDTKACFSSKVVCLTAHNAVLLYGAPPPSTRSAALEMGLPTVVRCRSQPLLYSGCFGPVMESKSGRAISVAAGTAIGPLHIWRCPLDDLPAEDVATSQVMAGHAGAAFDLKFASCGNLLSSVSDERTLRIWSVRPREQRDHADQAAVEPDPSLHVLWGHLGRIWRVAWAGEDERGRETVLTVGEDGRGILWAQTGDEGWHKLESLEGGHDGRSLWSVAADPQSCIAATGGADGAINLWPAPAPRRSASSQDAPGFVLTSPDGTSIKAFTVVDEDRIYFVTRAGALFVASNGTTSSQRASPTLLLSVPADLGASAYCRFGVTSSAVFVCSTAGVVFARARDDQATPRRIQLVDATVAAWKTVEVNGAPWALVYDRRRNAVEVFGLEPASDQAEATATASFNIASATYIASLHLASFGPSTSVLFAGTRAGDLLIWSLGSPHFAGPTVHKINDAGVSRIETWSAEDGCIGLRTLGRDGVLAQHLLRPSLALETLDERKLLQGTLHRVIPWSGCECFVGVEDGRCKVVRRSGELIAQWPCGTKEREWSVAVHGPGLAFFSIRHGVVDCQSWSYDRRLARPRIQPGGHGREIRSVALHSLDHGVFLSATAAENGVLRITAYSAGRRPRLLLMDASFVGSLKSVVWYSERADGPVFLAVAGSRELLQVFKIQPLLTPIEGVDLTARPWVVVSAPQATSDLRIVGLDFGPSTGGSSILLAGYSDGSVKVWALDLRLRNSRLLRNLDRRPCCVLAVKWLHTVVADDVSFVVGTDGRLVAYTPSAAVARVLSQPHVNGINCLDTARADGLVLVVTGGDDTDLVVSSFAWPGLEPARDPIRVTGAHLASLTGLKVIQTQARTLVVTASADQRIKLWALGSATLELLEQADTLVTDVASLNVLRIGDGLAAQVVGVGSEIVRFQHCIA